jgi:hypothetical protein
MSKDTRDERPGTSDLFPDLLLPPRLPTQQDAGREVNLELRPKPRSVLVQIAIQIGLRAWAKACSTCRVTS